MHLTKLKESVDIVYFLFDSLGHLLCTSDSCSLLLVNMKWIDGGFITLNIG